jgi:putative membrane protein
MARPVSPSVYSAAAGAFALMVLMALSGDGSARPAGPGMLLLFASGLAASAAMILPGVSGGYLLLLLGQYERVLGAVDQLKRGLLGSTAGAGPDPALLLEAMQSVIPLGLGVVAGVVGVSNLLRWLLRRYEKATLGALLGLLLGAVVGLWPFQENRAPEPGDVIDGRIVSAASAADFALEDWPVVRFDPSGAQMGGALALIIAGFGATLVIGRLGSEAPPEGVQDSVV